MERNVVKLICLMNKVYPPVAKLDIAVDSDSKGRGFESLRADHTCGEQIAHRRFFIIKSSARVYGRYLFCQRFPMKTTEKPCNYAG